MWGKSGKGGKGVEGRKRWLHDKGATKGRKGRFDVEASKGDYKTKGSKTRKRSKGKRGWR